MNGGHEAGYDAELVVEDLGDGSKAVGGAGSVRYELLAGIGVFVDAANEHGGVVLGGSRHNHVLGTGFDVGLSLFLGEEETGGLNNVFSAYFAPCDFFRVAASGNADGLAVDNEEALFEVIVNSAVELAVHGVIFEHVGHVIYGKKVVDGNYFDVIAFGRGTENEASDASETINTDFSHNCKL